MKLPAIFEKQATDLLPIIRRIQKNLTLPTTRWMFLIVAVVTFLCFFPTLHNGLLEWDDSGYIIENQHITNLSRETVQWAFGNYYLNYWAPLTWLSLAVDYAIWGLNPVGYHLTNNIIHALNAALFFLVALELLKRYSFSARANAERQPPIVSESIPVCALLAAIFFAVHPLRVESVAWATERKDVLSLLFGLLAVLAYLAYAKDRSMSESSGQELRFALSRYYWLTLFLYCLSLLSKTLMVTLPLVLLTLDWFPLKRLSRQNIKGVLLEKTPLILLAGLTSMIAMRSQSGVIFSFNEINMTTRVLNAFKSLSAYMQLTVWPFGLSPFYVHPVNIPTITPEYALPVVVFITITSCCIVLLKRVPFVSAVWLIYLVTLLPFLGFTQVGPQAMAGRFTYLAGLPLSLLFGVGVTAAFSRFSGSRAAMACLASAVAAVLLLNGYLTVREISFWKDDVTLWTRVIDLEPHATGRAYFQRSNAYAAQGDLQHALTDINEALVIATRKQYKSLHELYLVRARILSRLGDFDEAIVDYTSALVTADRRLRSYIYIERGDVYKRQGKTRQANEDFRLANTAADPNPFGER